VRRHVHAKCTLAKRLDIRRKLGLRILRARFVSAGCLPYTYRPFNVNHCAGAPAHVHS